MPLEQKAILEELLKRKKSRHSLADYAQYIKPDYTVASHHKKIIDILERVEKGELTRVCIFQPPRSGKSELVSKIFPSWYIGKNPTRQIIAASYGADLARDFGRHVRNTMQSNEYANIFPHTSLSPDSRSANLWHTNQGGVYLAVGVGSATSGYGAHLAIIDDPIKDRVEADSETTRNRIWDWYSSVLYTRRMPNAAIILCCTRWHESDLAGRILENKNESWEVLSLPAISNEHTSDEKALWPEWFPLEELKKTRATMIPRDWRALYQQQPTADEGDYFKKEWFPRHEFLDLESKDLNYYIGTDFAVSEKKGADETVFTVFGVDEKEKVYIKEVWHGRTSPDVWIEELIKLIHRYKPLCTFCEGGVIQKSIEPFLVKRMREKKIFCRVEWLTSATDKASRARGFQARSAMGLVSIPRNDVGEIMLSQFLKFPSGKHDDFVDACSIFFRGLEDVHAHHATIKRTHKKNDLWDTEPETLVGEWRLL